MAIKIYKKSENKQLSAHFRLSEFHCHGVGCCTTTKLDTKLLELCEKLRVHFGKPITINSGYRCPKHNALVGGDSNSSHKKGMAADIYVSDGSVTPLEMAKYAESIGVKRIGLYKSWIHIGSNDSFLFWDGTSGKNNYSTATFGGNRYTRPKRLLKLGCSGEDVKWLQYWLKDKHFYDGKIDGDFGVKTQKSVNLFKISKSYLPNGKIKVKSKNALLEE